ncbi:hypothetical protein AGMMS49574_21140 [Bacteroidia bacterium]|nr:hypothetical protein AGMMS49574_21140 [Bacteroidia bacterium]
MNRKNYILLLILLLPCFAVAQVHTQAHKDSLRSVIAATEGAVKLEAYQLLTTAYRAETRDKLKRDTVFALYDQMDAEAKKQDRVDVRALIRKNKINLLTTARLYDDVFQIAPGYMQFMADNNCWNEYFDTYDYVIMAYRQKGLYEQAVAEVQKMFDEAKKINNKGGTGVAFYAMGRIYITQRRFADAEQCFRDAIGMWRGDPQNYRRLIAVHSALAKNLVAQNRMDEALQIACENEKALIQYEEFSRSQQPDLRLSLYIDFRDIYRQSAQYDKAEIYCDKIDSISGGSYPQYEERAQILNSRKRYPEALEMIDRAIATSPARMMNQVRGMKMVILINNGDSKAANELLFEMIASVDSINNLRMGEVVDELRTQYEVDKITIEKIRNRNYFLFALGGCLLLSVALGIWIYYSRNLARKNRELVRKNQQWAGIATLEKQSEDEEDTAPEAIPEVVPEAAPDKTDRLLMNEIEIWMAEGLYKNPDLSLDMLAKKMNLHPNYVSCAVNRCSGSNFKTYINEYRVKEAIRLLSCNHEAILDTVAFDSGFNDRKTFHRVFKKMTGLSPADFRKNRLG